MIEVARVMVPDAGAVNVITGATESTWTWIVWLSLLDAASWAVAVSGTLAPSATGTWAVNVRDRARDGEDSAWPLTSTVVGESVSETFPLTVRTGPFRYTPPVGDVIWTDGLPRSTQTVTDAPPGLPAASTAATSSVSCGPAPSGTLAENE